MNKNLLIGVRKRTLMGLFLAAALGPFAICLAQAAASPATQVMSFGENIWGQLGNAGYTESNPTPTAVTLPGVIGRPIQVAAGEDHSIVLTSGGQIYTFGTGGLGSGNRYSEFRSPWRSPCPAPRAPL
jgi:Regulator of chromosome condensation (RCC1) repeat